MKAYANLIKEIERNNCISYSPFSASTGEGYDMIMEVLREAAEKEKLVQTDRSDVFE